MTSQDRGTDRPFTVIVCANCAAEQDLSVAEQLRPAIRRCPHAILVTAPCMLGTLACASRPSGGVMALLQPCTSEREASGPLRWIGPITDNEQAASLRAWLERGQWENTPVPERRDHHELWARGCRRSN